MALSSFRSIVLAAAAVAMTISTGDALSIYLKEIPNGESFSQELGHPDKDSSKYTAFAEAFAAAGHKWSKELCEDTFPGSSMTNGQAFGDPCCTWTKGATPDFEVTAFTTTPSEATTCAAEPAITTAAPAATTVAPPATTPAPVATTATPTATTGAPLPAFTSPTPATTKAPSSPGCVAKGSGGQKTNHSYNFRH